ncbi:hypothetical protein FOZ63_026712 [Perkinsus olseni]|uniref:Uncharacterized protein n=1 Tax=Perkinsus olseni TaxID=32597 RepID=A0A7J6PQH1_PEROL|nr:hypothetical protein FOZ62_029656 [Perkinsus olseni]KAF4704768.1 hypothetical protein FOZ63_026712 [Perkinsus olseni]
MPAARLWLYSVTLFNTMRWLPALISGNERMDAIRDILRKRYQRLGESRNAYAQLMAESRGDENDDDARFPPPGLYENKTLGIMVKNHGIHECTFTFVFGKYSSIVLPYSRMTPSIKGRTYNCFIPAGEQKVHKPGQALRNLLDIVWRPLEPSDIMLCHSVEGEVLMVSPNGLVTLSLMPSPPQERARNEGASAEVGTDHKRGNGKGRVERARRKARKVARSSPGDSSAAALRRVKRAKKSHPGRLDKGSKIPKVTRRQKVTVREKRSSKDHNANDHNDVLATAAASAGITGEDIDEEEENNSAPTNAVEDVTMSGARPRHQPSEPKRPWYLHSADQYDVDRSNLADSYEMEAALPTRTKGISKGNGGQEHWGERASPGGISWDEELSLGNPTEWFEDPTWEYLSRLYRVNRLL